MTITGNQIGAAMRLLQLTNQDVMSGADVSVVTMTRVLKGDMVKETTRKQVVDFLRQSGIDFLEHEGVRKRPRTSIMQYEGNDGFISFMKDVISTVSENGAEVCVSGVNERLFADAIGDYIEEYLAEITKATKMSGAKFNVIIKEGDIYNPASDYAKYREVASEFFQPSPSYIYGDKTAMIVFKDSGIFVCVVQSREIAAAQRAQFKMIWDVLGK